MTQLGAGSSAGTGAEPLPELVPQFLAALRGAELDVDGEMVADALWLAQFVTVEAVVAEADEVATGAERDIERAAQMRPEQRREPEPEVEAPAVEVVPQDGEPEPEETAGTGGAAGKVFQAPRAKALREARALGRALRPLKRRVRSANQQVLDEAATAERTAERRFCLPVMAAAPERWLEVALVVEEGPSMFLWRRTVQEFGQLLERQGAFRDVRTWRLQADDGGEYRLYAQGQGKPDKRASGRPRSAKELVDPAGRRLILLVSDCTSGLWRSDQVTKLLKTWGKEGLFSIVQLLPERLWSRTMLGYGSLARLSGLVPGTANGALRAEPLVWLDDEDGENRKRELLKLPVVTLEPGAMGGWAKVLAGFGSSRTGGVLLDLEEYLAGVEALPKPRAGASEAKPVELTEAEAIARVKQFQLGASSRLVCLLAGYMAAVPVRPPITDLIRETLLPGATQAHVAEVYMSGLMRRVRQPEADAEAGAVDSSTSESVQYEFIPAVRRVLVRTILVSQTEDVLEAVSGYLIRKYGLAVDGFMALLRLSGEGEVALDGEVRAFARFGLETLRQMGPRYGPIVAALGGDGGGSGGPPSIDGIPPLSGFGFETARIVFEDEQPAQDQPVQGQQQTQAGEVALERFEFETVQLDQRGRMGRRERLEAFQFIEGLGGGLVLEMVAVTGGEFVMGSPEGEAEREDYEGPRHWVTVPDFFMGKYPVTQAQWRGVARLEPVDRTVELKLNPSKFEGHDRPVEQVSWFEVREFCARLSRATGKTYRLPSEAEWEYACRAGTEEPFYFGKTLAPEVANYDGNYIYGRGPKGKYLEQTSDVGSYPANAWGLYGLHGNVWEWCEDEWHSSYNSAPNDSSAWVEAEKSENQGKASKNGLNRVLRGGSWINGPSLCRSAYRNCLTLDSSNYYCGFRVVCVSARTP